MGGSKVFPPGHFLLELDGVSAGDVKNFQGGGAVAEVIRGKPGADHIVHKHLGAVSYDDIVLTCGTGMTKAFYDWVARATAMNGGMKNGTVIVFEGGKEISRLDWISGQITEIDFPTLDTASSDSFSMTIKIIPERTRSVKGAGKPAVVTAGKNWLAGSFHLTIDGLEEACKHVSRIEPISIAFKMRSQELGGIRGYSQSELWSVDPGNLAITLTESKAKGFNDWFQDFVINGNNGQDREKNGRLELGPFSLKFGNLGIFRMTKPSNPSGAIARKAKVEMYCESIRFSASSR